MSELAEMLRKVMDHRLAEVRTAMPVRVESYDVVTQTVDVVPLVREITETTVDDNDDIEEALPVIPSVPVAFPRAGGFFVTFPIVTGDTGQIVICDRSIDQWRARGGAVPTVVGDGPEVSYSVHPLDKRQHHASAAVFYPGLADSLSPLLDAHATDMVLGQDGGSSIHIKPTGEIHIGDSPTKFVALDDDKTAVDTGMAAWMTAVDTAIGQIAVILNVAPPAPVVSAAGSVTPSAPSAPSDFGVVVAGATKVRAD